MKLLLAITLVALLQLGTATGMAQSAIQVVEVQCSPLAILDVGRLAGIETQVVLPHDCNSVDAVVLVGKSLGNAAHILRLPDGISPEPWTEEIRYCISLCLVTGQDGGRAPDVIVGPGVQFTGSIFLGRGGHGQDVLLEVANSPGAEIQAVAGNGGPGGMLWSSRDTVSEIVPGLGGDGGDAVVMPAAQSDAPPRTVEDHGADGTDFVSPNGGDGNAVGPNGNETGLDGENGWNAGAWGGNGGRGAPNGGNGGKAYGRSGDGGRGGDTSQANSRGGSGGQGGAANAFGGHGGLGTVNGGVGGNATAIGGNGSAGGNGLTPRSFFLNESGGNGGNGGNGGFSLARGGSGGPGPNEGGPGGSSLAIAGLGGQGGYSYSADGQGGRGGDSGIARSEGGPGGEVIVTGETGLGIQGGSGGIAQAIGGVGGNGGDAELDPGEPGLKAEVNATGGAGGAGFNGGNGGGGAILLRA